MPTTAASTRPKFRTTSEIASHSLNDRSAFLAHPLTYRLQDDRSDPPQAGEVRRLPRRALHRAQRVREAHALSFGKGIIHQAVQRRPGRVIALVNILVVGIAPAAVRILH